MSAMLDCIMWTPPEWAQRVLAEPGPLLLDHLFAEKRRRRWRCIR